MTEIKRLTWKLKKHKKDMTWNDVHRTQRELAEALTHFTQELIDKAQ